MFDRQLTDSAPNVKFPVWRFPPQGSKGNPVRLYSQIRGCPRNCERRVHGPIRATGKPGRPGRERRPASQETCRHGDVQSSRTGGAGGVDEFLLR